MVLNAAEYAGSRAGIHKKLVKSLKKTQNYKYFNDKAAIVAGSPEIQDFMIANPGQELQLLIETLTLYQSEITEEQAQSLFDIASPLLKNDFTYDSSFDIAGEIAAQIQAVRAMRRSVMSEGGNIKQNVSARELKEVVSASSTLLQTLMKTHEKVMGYSRQQAIEKAVITVVRDMGKETQTLFFSSLEAELELIS